MHAERPGLPSNAIALGSAILKKTDLVSEITSTKLPSIASDTLIEKSLNINKLNDGYIGRIIP